MSANLLGTVGVSAISNIKENGEAIVQQMATQGEAVEAQMLAKSGAHTTERNDALAAMVTEAERRSDQVEAKKAEILGLIEQTLGTVNSTIGDGTVYALGKEIQKADQDMDKLVENKVAEKSTDISDYDSDLGIFVITL